MIYLKKSLNKGEMFCDLSLLTGSFYLFFKISFLESLLFVIFAEILFRELMARDVALRHYVHYLKEMGEQKLLVELLK